MGWVAVSLHVSCKLLRMVLPLVKPQAAWSELYLSRLITDKSAGLPCEQRSLLCRCSQPRLQVSATSCMMAWLMFTYGHSLSTGCWVVNDTKHNYLLTIIGCKQLWAVGLKDGRGRNSKKQWNIYFTSLNSRMQPTSWLTSVIPSTLGRPVGRIIVSLGRQPMGICIPSLLKIKISQSWRGL